MNLNLGEQWEEYVRKHVESGRYNSASELIRECLRLHQEKEMLFECQLKQLGADIDKGYESYLHGDGVDREKVLRKIQQKSSRRRKIRT